MIEEIELPKPVLIEDLGMRFPTKYSKQKKKYGLYKCGFCGTEFKANTNDINRGYIKSCGCYGKKIKAEGTNRKHNLCNTRIHKIWRNLKNRTLNPKNKNYKDYGGRGITVCEEWKNDFMSFYNWAMENDYSDKLSLDRIDNDGNYEPDNCRWTTRTIQTRNQRIYKNNTSGYKGVSFNKDKLKYTAQICVNRNSIYIGSYLNVIEGAIAYNNYIIENNLEGFILNEIPDKILTNE